MAKCVLLYSGGLDSILAAKVLMEQGIEVFGFHCVLPFTSPDEDLDNLGASVLAKENGINIVHDRCGQEYIDMVKNPAHGYGKQMNPCIDCKIFFINRAAEYMKEIGADFIATGEVVGQRPMSQLKHTLNHIRNETNLDGRLLRPLSAKLLNPTAVEESGLVDRERLLDISGRSRKVQMELTKKYGIENYSSPAGGCHFTDKNIADRVKDLYDHHDDYSTLDFHLLTVGRHFRINDRCKAIVSRREEETHILEKYKSYSDYFLESDFQGPVVFIKGELIEDDYSEISKIFARYGKPDENLNDVQLYQNDTLIKHFVITEKIDDNSFLLKKI